MSSEESPTTDEAPEFSPEEIMEEAKEEALDFLEGLLDSMELEGEVSLEEGPGGALLANIHGEDAGILIGRRGQTLDALQDLLRTAVQRHVQGRVRINLDIEGYRERRKETLTEMAKDLAQAALTEGESELEPMSAFERKVVHDTVANIEGVTSFSEGEEPNRRVIIKSEGLSS